MIIWLHKIPCYYFMKMICTVLFLQKKNSQKYKKKFAQMLKYDFIKFRVTIEMKGFYENYIYSTLII